MSNTAAESRIRRINKINARIRALAKQKDDLTLDMVDRFQLGVVVDVDGVQYHLQDNFKGSNVVFRPAGVRQYEVVKTPKNSPLLQEDKE